MLLPVTANSDSTSSRASACNRARSNPAHCVCSATPAVATSLSHNRDGSPPSDTFNTRFAPVSPRCACASAMTLSKFCSGSQFTRSENL